MLIKDFENGIYQNRTIKYCTSMLKGWKGLPLAKWDIVAVGLWDEEKPDLYDTDSLGVLINARNSKLDFSHKAIKHDYYYGELLYGKGHMLVIDVFNKGLIKHFISGEYSKLDPSIYGNHLQTNILGNKVTLKDVILKSDKVRTLLEKRLGTTVEGEFDSVPNLKEEVYGYE